MHKYDERGDSENDVVKCDVMKCDESENEKRSEWLMNRIGKKRK